MKNATTNALIKQYTYGYDVAANRTSELVGAATTTSTSNSINEIISQSGGTNRTLTYDANGSLINDGASRTFEWDGLSRMVKIVEKSKNGRVASTRKFVWCGMDKCEFRDASDAVSSFIYPQGEVRGSTSYFYTRDHLGSIREMRSTGKKGAIVARFDYDPYGRSTTVVNNTLPDFNFTGLYRHSASNLDLAVYRAYDPDLGRWLSRDPIEEYGGINLYGYVGNDALNLADPLGLFWFYGNWGGPNWVSGQIRSESDRIPRRGDSDYRAPIDKMDALFERHDVDLHRAHNLQELSCESDDEFRTRQQALAEQADRRLAYGLKNLPWYYHVGPLNIWREPAEALFGWGPHRHGYQ